MRPTLRGPAAARLSPWLLLLIAACDCGSDPLPTRTCMTALDCRSDEACLDGICVSSDSDAGPRPDGATLMCEDEREPCTNGSFQQCCAADQVCASGRCQTDCGELVLCGSACCAAGQECLDGSCVAMCEDASRRCGAASELCCTSDQACLGNACVDLGATCTLTEECELDELCEPGLGRCVPRTAVEVCEFRPPVGEFDPIVGCRWLPEAGDRASSVDVVMTPAVANLTDDNGDGLTDTNDIPDIVLVSFNGQTDGCCTANGTLRVVSGLCNADGTMDTLATITDRFIDNSTGVAVGNLHPDSMADERVPEIVATRQNAGTVAFRRTASDGSTWEILWENTQYLRNARYNGSGSAPSIADLDGDGQPEVIVGNVVLNGLTGELIWDGAVTVRAGAGVGNNAFLGPTSTVANLDLVGGMEVIAGNTVYDGATGAEVWTYTFTTDNSACGGSVSCDGFNAVGNFDDDPEGEVVIVRRGEVFVIEHDGTLKTRVAIPRDDVMPFLGNGPCGNNESGPPTVADFDGDGRAEIGTASADFYVVVDLDCTGDPLPAGCAAQNILWRVPNQDCSSRATGSSVFDFDGDGRAEVVYADEENFRIFDGRTGAILYDDPDHNSNTRLEMPIVVDVDNDGKSEVLLPQAPRQGPSGGSRGLPGLAVITDRGNNWVRTRRIWNQHTYHVTNVTEDGQIPRVEEANWSSSRLNNFRQNVQPGGIFDAPDLYVVSIEIEECDPSGTVRVAVVVGNRGALGVAAGVPVIASATPTGGSAEALGVERTTTFLLPGRTERVIFEWSPAGGFTFPTFTVEATVDSDGMGGSEYNECDEENNGATSEALMTCSFG
ncbi:MAG: hypothetical protein H6722_02425 [Sandaracinus sp.]|nr:hypothetical protein [Sandaracinus sp.]